MPHRGMDREVTGSPQGSERAYKGQVAPVLN
jgi:hypothetical protein